MQYTTTYRHALEFGHIATILCNDIAYVDKSYIPSEKHLEECMDSGDYGEVFQYYITDADADDVRWMEEHFNNIYFGYSPMLGLHILEVTHYGTSWDYVTTETDIKQAAKERGEGWKENR